MTLRLATDMQQVEQFLLSEEYLLDVAEDNVELNGVLKSLEKTSHQDYLIYSNDAQDMGFISIRPITNSCWLVHPFLLKAYRKHIRDMMTDLYMQLISQENCVNKVVVCIPIMRPNVINWAKKVGMIVEGVNHAAYYKRGEYQDCYWMGITKEQMVTYLENNNG